jgi:hypothetical protein
MKTLLILASLAGLNSCSLTVGPDGSKNASFDGEQFMKAIIIHSEK